mgnify:CR=1 FL=1
MTFAAASDDDRERYSYGQCMWFALAVHDRTGWPLEVVLDEEGFIEHAWARMPDGQTFDVMGPGGAEDFIASPTQVQAVSRAELVGLAGGEENREAVVQAGLVFEAMHQGPDTPRRRPSLKPR